MLGLLRRYTHWLHTGWPAGTVEKLPEVDENGQTSIPGLYVVGDLTGIPLLKLSADSGARAVQHIAADGSLQRGRGEEAEAGVLDLAIIGAGVSGMAAALEARRLGLSYEILGAADPFPTLINFLRAKPIYTSPTDMVRAGELRFEAQALIDELKAQTLDQGIEPRQARVEPVERRIDLFELAAPDGESLRARRVVVAIGRSGNYRKLGVPGEELDKVYNRLHDPEDFRGQVLRLDGLAASPVRLQEARRAAS